MRYQLRHHARNSILPQFVRLEAGVGIEPTNEGFAGPPLTTWVSRPNLGYLQNSASGTLKSNRYCFWNCMPAKLTTLFSSMFHCSYCNNSPRAFGAVFKNV